MNDDGISKLVLQYYRLYRFNPLNIPLVYNPRLVIRHIVQNQI
jgi:hypothetical protein